ncbi:MAG: transcriptional repressor, partial [Sneathiella sp.]
VIEFTSDQIEELQKKIAAELGFELIDHRLELYGKPLKGQAGQRVAPEESVVNISQTSLQKKDK